MAPEPWSGPFLPSVGVHGAHRDAGGWRDRGDAGTRVRRTGRGTGWRPGAWVSIAPGCQPLVSTGTPNDLARAGACRAPTSGLVGSAITLVHHSTRAWLRHDDTDAGCLQHAAEEWTRWDHGGEVTIEVLGPAKAAAVADLGTRMRAERQRTGRCIADELATDRELLTVPAEDLALEAEFVRLGLTDARNHYRQAVKNFVEQDFEAANGQLRTMFEAVIINVAMSVGFQPQKAGEGGNAINYLKTNGHLPDRDGGNFIQGLWWIVSTNGPHPGTTTAGEVHFRMLTMTGAARYLIDRFYPRVP
jgi:hypothetical protein